MKQRRAKTDFNSGRQLFGLALIGIAILLILSIVSFSPKDPVNVDVVDNPVQVNNWLGPLGAWLSHFIMQWTLGYAALVFPFLIFIAGYVSLRNSSFSSYYSLIWKTIAWSVIISVLLIFPSAIESGGDLTEYYPSGLAGGWLASLFVLYLGKIGSIVLVLMLVTLMAVVSINIEMNQIISKISKFFFDLKILLQDKWQEFKSWRNERKEQKELEQQLKQQQIEENIEPEINLGEKPDKEILNKNIVQHAGIPEASSLAEINLDDENRINDLLDESEELNSEKNTEPTVAGEKEDFEFKEEVKEEQLDYDDLVKESIARFKYPSIELLNSPPADRKTITKEELRNNAELLELKLLDYGVKAKVIRVTAGPVITLYELQPAAGVKVSSIVSLENDLALAMEARGIRIIAPIPGKAAVGIEIPNRHPQMVYLKSLIRSEKFIQKGFELPLAIGKAINGESFVIDLVKMPHLLIAGATGAGKSVGINTIICSLLFAVDPGRVKFVMIDPKKLELSLYKDMRDQYLLWRPDLDEEVITKPNNAVSMLNTMVLEMERRQERMHKMGVRSIREYNEKILKNPGIYKKTEHQQMPYIVIIIEELADLMMVAQKEVEIPIARLAQMARAGGIHMIVATQRPSVDVITGLIKANLPARIAYQVATKVDSRTILDVNGAEQLLGNGDLLFKLTGTKKPLRLQNPFVATEEVEAVIKHINKQPKLPYYSLPQPSESRRETFDKGFASDVDPLYEDARAIVVQSQQGSISLLQRRLKIGYSRAARLIDDMEEEGIVGAAIGGKPREVLMTLQELNTIS